MDNHDQKTRIMTIDLEPDLGSRECKSIHSVVPRLLDFCDHHKIKATFFTVTSLLEKYESEIKEIAKKHEIASHSHTHHALNPVNARWEIENSRRVLKEYSLTAFGFRAPMFITTKDHLQLVKDAGYSYDASFARYLPTRYQNLTLPGKPFVKEGIVEFPTPNFTYPILNSGLPYLKAFHPLSKAFPKPYLFYLHPWEFLERDHLKGNTFLTRNCGERAWSIFEKYIERCGGKWINCKRWMEEEKSKEKR
ncbi:polysaccharide deacetylase family protein [Candidatus Woesearchaeota archaeon]|nr:polysaccharide deacetylase family protein [Candidatus Woesearchaeota archaeon]